MERHETFSDGRTICVCLVRFIIFGGMLACGGQVAPEPISLCAFDGSASGMIDPVKFCELIPWYWVDSQGNKHPCTETCATGSVCHYNNGDDPAFGAGHCVQP